MKNKDCYYWIIKLVLFDILTRIPLTPFKCIFYKVEEQEIKPETIQHPQGNYAWKTNPPKKTVKPNSKQILLDFRTNVTLSFMFSLYYFSLSDQRGKGVSKASLRLLVYWNHSPKSDLQMFLNVCTGLLIAVEICLEISCYWWFLL